MGRRDLLFVSLIFGGIAALCGNLFPERVPVATVTAETAPPSGPAAAVPPVVADIDRKFREQWSTAKIEPAKRASNLEIARRLSLALTGTIPSLQEIRQLEARPADQQMSLWLERIFHDRRYGDYFAERLARTYVGTEDGPFLVYRRRRFVSWLSDELMHNRPYNQLARELIAGQGLWTDKPATNFITATFEPDKNSPNAERLAARAARAFLGIRLDCVQCHDQKLDYPAPQWKQHDFQGLAAFFGQVHQGFTGIYDGQGEFQVENRKTGEKDIVKEYIPEQLQPELLEKNGSRRQQLAGWITHDKNPYFSLATANRVWALLFGLPLVEPVDDLAGVAVLPPVLRLLADDFVAHDYDLQHLIRAIAATEAFQLSSRCGPEVTVEQVKAWAAFPLTRLRPEQVVGGILQAASVATINQESHIFLRFLREVGENEFVKRYGDTGEDEFIDRGGTIPQRLLMLNGKIVHEKTEPNPFNAATRIGFLASDDASAVEVAYLTVLTRRPTLEEAKHFEARLAGTKGDGRGRRMSDLFRTLINSTEFSWNH